jgi:Cys-tRNA(Pro)/Cys-tRNA(Cys) deacylase
MRCPKNGIINREKFNLSPTPIPGRSAIACALYGYALQKGTRFLRHLYLDNLFLKGVSGLGHCLCYQQNRRLQLRPVPDMNGQATDEVFPRLQEIVRRSGLPHVIHEHQATRTIDDAARNLSFDVHRIVKTIAFRTRDGRLILAALRGTRRVDYARLAPLVGVNRRDLAPLSPDGVLKLLGVEPGSVSPLMPMEGGELLIDEDVLAIIPTLYCGFGRPEKTLEIAAADLVRLTGGRVGAFSRKTEHHHEP